MYESTQYTARFYVFVLIGFFVYIFFLHLLLPWLACASLFISFSSSILNDCIIWCMHMECTRASAMSSMIFLVFFFSFHFIIVHFPSIPYLALLNVEWTFQQQQQWLCVREREKLFGFEMKVIVLLFLFHFFLVYVIKL